MADSITERILQAIVAALNGPDKPGGLVVNRSRRQSIETSQLPMMSVQLLRYEDSLPGENRRSPIADVEMEVHVICRVLGDEGALDPLRKWAVRALMADPSLGNLALGIRRVFGEVDTDDTSDANRTVETIVFRVRHTTSRFNLENKA
jgi:hypothetical protein